MVSYDTNTAIARLVETYSPMLLRLASTRLHSTADAEDAVQEVFLYLLTHHVTFHSEEHEKAWLIRATIHRACDLQKRASRADLPLENASPSCAAPQETPALVEAVRSLPEKYSSPLYLHYYAGYSIKEIGKLLGLPAATVGTRLSRGRERLRKILKEE